MGRGIVLLANSFAAEKVQHFGTTAVQREICILYSQQKQSVLQEQPLHFRNLPAEVTKEWKKEDAKGL